MEPQLKEGRRLTRERFIYAFNQISCTVQQNNQSYFICS